MTQTQQQIEQLPPPPRPISRAARRRAWGDVRVRLWWICAVVIGAIALLVAVNQLIAALRERSLIATGTPVKAKVIGLEGSRGVGYTLPRTDSLDVVLELTLPNGRVVQTEGVLPPFAGTGSVKIGQSIDIRVDPENPSRWTERNEVVSWGVELAIPLILLPLVLLLLGIALFRRRQVLRIWRDGEPALGVVIELHQSAIAPLSRLVRYTPANRGDKRILSSLIPARHGIPAVGETIQLVALPDGPDRMVVAGLYR